MDYDCVEQDAWPSAPLPEARYECEYCTETERDHRVMVTEGTGVYFCLSCFLANVADVANTMCYDAEIELVEVAA